jgi:hypothetical protein
VTGQYREDEAGNIAGIAAASVSYRDPVNVETFEKTEAAAYRNILEEARQLHRLIARDATASGESRVQARADFVTSLRDTKTQLDAAGRWVLETALALAAALAGQPGRFASLRVRFESQLDTGPLSSEERRVIAEEVERKLRSRQNAMALLSIDDPAAMLDEIISEIQMLTPEELTPAAAPSGDAMGNQSGQGGEPVTVQ